MFSPHGQQPCLLWHQAVLSQKEQGPLPQGYDQFYQRGLIFSHPTFDPLGISRSNEKSSVSNKQKIQKLICPILECVGRHKDIYCEVPVIGKDTKIAENFPHLGKETGIQVLAAQRIPFQINKTRSTPTCHSETGKIQR